MTPEGKVKHEVKKVLADAKAYYHMPVVNGMGKPSLDFIVCHKGLFIAIETKAPGGRLTMRQEMTIEEMRTAGALVFIINGPDCPDMTQLKIVLGAAGGE